MIDIKNIDGSVLFSVLPDDSAVFHEELMASDYVKLSWDSDVYQVIPAGAYIEYEGERYKLLENYTPTQQDECTYQYTPQFQSRVMNWDKQITPVYTYEEDGTTVKSREMDWEFTGSPADAMYIVKQAIKNETGEDWTIQLAESLPATITISSQSSSIFATLNTIANECETEWWADKKTNTLYLSKCIFGDAVKLEVGYNVQVPTVTNDSEGYFTRFYAFGSKRNITQDYDGGQATNSIVNKRLTLNPTKCPNGYKDIKDGLKPDEVFVKVLYFDDIYPSSKLTISDVRARLKYRLDNNGQKIRIGGTDSEPIYEQYAIWYFQIEGFTFDPSTDVIEGLNLSASFESGQLAGRDFELTYHEKASNVNDAADVTAFNIKAGDYEIVIDESSGTIIPGTSYIIPQDGDSLVLFNIVMPDEYVTSAQDELEKALDNAMLSYTEDNNTYQMASDPTRFYENNTDIQMGQAVTFVNGGKSLSTRVQMVEKRLDLSCYQTIKIGNKIIKGNTQQLKDEVASVNQNLDVIKAFNELSSSLSQAYANAQREMIEGFASIKNLWTLETDEQGNQYAYTQYDIFGKGGITAYTSRKPQVPSIFDGLPLDNVTIWKNPSTGLIEVIGGSSGGSSFDASKMWELLGASTTEQINKSHLTTALSGYATESWVQSQGYATQSALNSVLYSFNGNDFDPNTYDGYYVGMTTKSGISTDWWHILSMNWGEGNTIGNKRWSSQLALPTEGRSGLRYRSGNGDSAYRSWVKVWDESNDGNGSGLDADLLDGFHAKDTITFGGDINSAATVYKAGLKVFGITGGGSSNLGNGWGSLIQLCNNEARDYPPNTTGRGDLWYSQLIFTTDNRARVRFSTNGSAWTSQYLLAYISDTVDSANRVKVYQHTDNNLNFPIVWTDENNTDTKLSNLFKSWNHLCYNPYTKILTAVNILATGGVTCYSSDARAKTIIEELNLSLKQIAESPTIRFKWNGWKIKDDGKMHVGGIAQYVQKLLPECVLDTDDFLNLDYATTAYIYSVQTARHLKKYETKTDKKIRKLEKEIVYLKQQLKKL